LGSQFAIAKTAARRLLAMLCVSLPLYGLAASISTPNAAMLTDKDGRIRIQLNPRNEVVLSSELSAKIDRLPLREGDSFRAGQTLVGFDCSLFQAQLQKSQATLEGAEQLLKVNRRLSELNSIGELEVQQAQARLKESRAEVSFMQTTVRKCAISAPFTGRVAKRIAAEQQYVTPGSPILGIVETGQLELQMIVPSRWLAWLKPGARLSVLVDELDKQFPAEVSRIGARIDPVSQSINVVATINGNQPGLLPGMSGWASFPVVK
jgi:membrane fusion protein, multidrug efflux system